MKLPNSTDTTHPDVNLRDLKRALSEISEKGYYASDDILDQNSLSGLHDDSGNLSRASSLNEDKFLST